MLNSLHLLPMRLAFALMSLFIISACGSKLAVSTQQAQQQIQQGALILDVRSQDEWQAGHLADAQHMPIDTFEQQLASLDATPDQPIVVYCKSGGRASHAGKLLQQHGYSAVSVLRPGGYAELKSAGLRVEEPTDK